MLALPRPARACQCEASFSTCNEVRTSDLVFIGTVESVEPVFPSRWDLSKGASLELLDNAFTVARERPPAAALARLKGAVSKIFPGLGEDEKDRLEAATAIPGVMSVFNSAVDGGARVRFKVKTLQERRGRRRQGGQSAQS